MFFFACIPLLSARAEDLPPKSVNSAAAIRALSRSADFLAARDWADAAFEAQLGHSYDPSLADFPYVEALSLVGQKASRAEILQKAQESLTAGLVWRSYSRNDAIILRARLEAETIDYAGALSTLASLRGGENSDAVSVRILSLYGLGRVAEARKLVASSLEKWPFDPKFARVFLVREASLTPDEASLAIAATILSRLYLWENEDRELLLLAVPFETDPDSRDRNIRTYRGMGARDPGEGNSFVPVPASALAALEYGALDEESAAAEILSNAASGIRLSDLESLCRLVGKATVRATIAETLKSYDGIIVDDANRDGIDDSWVRYRLGRPQLARFDKNQDGKIDYEVSCDIGRPTEIAVGSAETVIFDAYPDVKTVRDGAREYALRPLALSWAPVAWVREGLRLAGVDFFALKLTGTDVPLTERLLVSSSAYFTEADGARGEKRVSLERGTPISSETRDSGRLVAKTTYRKGFPSSTVADRDGDGYFETSTEYDSSGVVRSVAVDRNADRAIEYREDYGVDGSVTRRWDSDEDGVFEISQVAASDGTVRTRWVHPITGMPVTLTVEGGSPRSIEYAGKTIPVVRDPIEALYWVRAIPSGSRAAAKKIVSSFNPEDPSVVTLRMNLNGATLFAIRTGGLIFAELLDE